MAMRRFPRLKGSFLSFRPVLNLRKGEVLMSHEILSLRSVHPTKGYSHVAKVGKTLYISGQVAQDVNGNPIQEPFPASSLVAVQGLASPDGVFAVEGSE